MDEHVYVVRTDRGETLVGIFSSLEAAEPTYIKEVSWLRDTMGRGNATEICTIEKWTVNVPWSPVPVNITSQT